MVVCFDYSKLGQILIISLFFFVDLLFTYFFAVKYTSMFPKDKNWYKFEMNIILRNAWRKWGANKGTLIGVICVYPIIFTLGYLINNQFTFGLVIGAYMIIFLVHIGNFQFLNNYKLKKKKKKRKKRKEKKEKKI